MKFYIDIGVQGLILYPVMIQRKFDHSCYKHCVTEVCVNPSPQTRKYEISMTVLEAGLNWKSKRKSETLNPCGCNVEIFRLFEYKEKNIYDPKDGHLVFLWFP